MDAEQFRSKFYGVIAFPVTPFGSDLSLDINGLRKNLQALIKHPVCAIVAAAGTGELYSLDAEEQLEVAKATVAEVKGRVPVLAAVGFNGRMAAAAAKNFKEAGVDALLAFPPYYPGANEEGLANYYLEIGKATDLPLIIYSRDWVNPTPKLVKHLADKLPNLVAWKDGQADLRRYQAIMTTVGDRLHWIGGAGDDMVPGYYSIGIRTYTSSIANVAPRLSQQMHELAASDLTKDLQKIMRELVIPLYEFRARRKGYEVSVMKAMMDKIGLVGGPVRPPLLDLTSQEKAELDPLIENWKSWL